MHDDRSDYWWHLEVAVAIAVGALLAAVWIPILLSMVRL